jgi:hypothetical protein
MYFFSELAYGFFLSRESMPELHGVVNDRKNVANCMLICERGQGQGKIGRQPKNDLRR